MDYIAHIWIDFLNGVPDVVAALIILILAFATATLVKYLISKLMKTVKIDFLFSKAKIEEERREKTKDFIAKLFYFITFILWMPGFFERLGMNGVASPIINMMNIVLAYLPNIIGAILLLIVGLFIAKTVKELLIPLFKKLKIDQYLKKVGVDSKNEISVAEVFANTVYVLILIPIVIGALNVLHIDAISNPAISMLDTILAYIPKIILALVIFFVGKFIAKIVFALLEKLFESIGLDKISDKVFTTTGTNVNKNVSLSKILAYIVQYVILILFTVQALNVIELEVLTKIGSTIIAYLPYAVSGILMLGIAILLANYVQKIVLKSFPNSKATAILLKVLIIILGVFVTLYQLGVATDLVNSAFIIILGSIAVALAIAFGVGGREFASHMLAKAEKKLDEKKK
ncbi:MAG: mechanosensitive ion channel [Clostridia bacterium]|nr:mechanosensitive ion channel [Clostridia bacterium]